MSEWSVEDLVRLIGRGLMSIDEGRVELGFVPWGLPETSDPLPQDEDWRPRVRKLVEFYERMLTRCPVRHDPDGWLKDAIEGLKRELGL